MTETAKKLNIIGEFKALGYKQWIGIVAGFIIAMVLTATGMILSMCLGFFIVAILLYMIPHVTGVKSVPIKAIVGAVFVVAILIVVAFAYSGSATNSMGYESKDHSYIQEATWDGENLIITPSDKEADYKAEYFVIGMMNFGYPAMDGSEKRIPIELNRIDGKIVGHVELPKGKYYYIQVDVLDKDGNRIKGESFQVFYNNGMSASDVNALNLRGSGLTIAEIGLVYYLLLIFSALMRRSAEKTRAKMEKDGRLYPAGYDKCKQCGCLVLPGEITCRKCGAPIEVPEEIKVLHKKDFFVCSECGTEVPVDAQFCPKCGEKFNEETENVITHVDGTVDVSTETFTCSDCGKVVPANAQRCPYCGALFDEDDESETPKTKQ